MPSEWSACGALGSTLTCAPPARQTEAINFLEKQFKKGSSTTASAGAAEGAASAAGAEHSADAAAAEAEAISRRMGTDEVVELAVTTLATVLAQDLKAGEIEIGIVGGPHAATELDEKDPAASKLGAEQRRFRKLTEEEISVVLERLAERD